MSTDDSPEEMRPAIEPAKATTLAAALPWLMKYHGKVVGFGAGTGSAFAVLPAQNATGNWIKIVQRVPVRVFFDDPTQLDQHPLRIGLSTDVEVNLHDQTGPMLARQAPSQPAFKTDVYARQMAEADSAIGQIIHANMAGQK